MRTWKSLLSHRDDKRYVKIIVDGFPLDVRRALLWGYVTAWEDAEAKEPVPHRRDNAGRRAANEWIRQEALALRFAEPEDVKHWREAKHRHAPACCHTCEFYDQDGHCTVFDQDPPEDFAAMIGACDQWEEEIPF